VPAEGGTRRRVEVVGEKPSANVGGGLASIVQFDGVHGGKIVCVKASFTTPEESSAAPDRSAPRRPLRRPLGRQLSLSPQVFSARSRSTMTREKPKPSVIGYHLLYRQSQDRFLERPPK